MGSLDGSLSKTWTTPQQRLLHQHRERQWLRRKAKHRYLDFSDSELVELKRYFDCLTEGEPRVKLDKMEDMLISLGLAETRAEVAGIVDLVDSESGGEIDFEEYLDILKVRGGSDIVDVFKTMTDGRLGDPNLNFQTVISACRRAAIFDAIGSNGGSAEQQELGCRILGNFAALQRSRHA